MLVLLVYSKIDGAFVELGLLTFSKMVRSFVVLELLVWNICNTIALNVFYDCRVIYSASAFSVF